MKTFLLVLAALSLSACIRCQAYTFSQDGGTGHYILDFDDNSNSNRYLRLVMDGDGFLRYSTSLSDRYVTDTSGFGYVQFGGNHIICDDIDGPIDLYMTHYGDNAHTNFWNSAFKINYPLTFYGEATSDHYMDAVQGDGVTQQQYFNADNGDDQFYALGAYETHATMGGGDNLYYGPTCSGCTGYVSSVTTNGTGGLIAAGAINGTVDITIGIDEDFNYTEPVGSTHPDTIYRLAEPGTAVGHWNVIDYSGTDYFYHNGLTFTVNSSTSVITTDDWTDSTSHFYGYSTIEHVFPEPLSVGYLGIAACIMFLRRRGADSSHSS